MQTCPRLSLAAVLLLLGAALPATAAPPPESGKIFEAAGASVYYEVLGGGPGTPLVVANGGPGFDHAYLHVSDIWSALARDRPVVLYDQRGNGRSGGLKTGQSCTLADQIADLEALRAHLGYARIDLLGHSWGGYLAMAYASRHPDRIERLVLADSAAPKWADTLFLFKEVYPEGVERQDALAFADTLGDTAAGDASLREYMAMLFYSPEKRDGFLAAAPGFRYSRSVNQAVNTDLARFDLNPELPKLRFPALVVTGRYDMNVAPATAYRIHRAIPGSKFMVFERSGHLPFYEEPEAFLKGIGDFLAGR
ncbi:MAG TPA: alpha/beta fold hydrolase [Thermoanaerobaculia bacterium]|jgi:proline iminopeptidase|nr:alpha/beta fold hydrolase [Thermoanaerobaculia bacterium]